MTKEHPLTDKICLEIAESQGASKYRAEYTHYFLKDYMRAAYDLGESKGRADMLDQVIEWLDAIIFENFFEDSLWSEDLACVPRRLREAMRPQEEI